ncbi:MAG: hypothetical protein ACFB2X_01450 [Rivularia sp. (in: cyanobacteria)]
MTNIKDFPELTNPSDADWILIQENSSIPAYKKTQLLNIRSIGFETGNSESWIYVDGTVDFTINNSSKLLLDTPRDVFISLGDLADGAEVEIKRLREDNDLFITGISRIQGNDINGDSLIEIPFKDVSIKLIYINYTFGWFLFPESNFTILATLNIPTEGLIQLFNAANILASNGDRIPLWKDEFSNKNATQNSFSYQPQYIESIFAQQTIGGLFFEAFQEYEIDLTYFVNQYYTIAIVEASTYAGENYFFGNSSGGTNIGLHVGYRFSTTFTLSQFGNDLDASVESYSGTLNPILWVVSNNSRGKEIFRNGTLISSNTNTDALLEVDSGRIGSSLGSFYDGYLGLICTWIGDKSLSDIAEISNSINSTFGVY